MPRPCGSTADLVPSALLIQEVTAARGFCERKGHHVRSLLPRIRDALPGEGTCTPHIARNFGRERRLNPDPAYQLSKRSGADSSGMLRTSSVEEKHTKAVRTDYAATFEWLELILLWYQVFGSAPNNLVFHDNTALSRTKSVDSFARAVSLELAGNGIMGVLESEGKGEPKHCIRCHRALVRRSSPSWTRRCRTHTSIPHLPYVDKVGQWHSSANARTLAA